MADMHTQTLAYWRSALADSQLGQGMFSAAQVRGLYGRGISFDQLKGQSVESEDAWLTSGSEQAATLSMKDVESWLDGQVDTWVRCVVYPYVYIRTHAHKHGLKIRSLSPEMIAPVSFTILVNARGEMISHGRPGIARELLEPSHGARPLVLGSLEDLDRFFDENAFPDWLDEQNPVITDRWSISEVLEYSDRLIDQVVSVSLTRPLIEDTQTSYTLAPQGLIHKAQQISAAVRPLTEAYDAALELNRINGVFKSVATGSESRNTKVSVRRRAGGFERGRILGSDQRYALTEALSLDVGGVLAVQGPPGTGKTTILQDLLANLLVNAAIENREPDLVVVASTNNQAVTNVLDTFGRVDLESAGGLGQRWVDVPDSLGLFIASHQRASQAEANGYLTPDRVARYENDLDIHEQVQSYLSKAVEFIPGVKDGDSLETATAAIQEMICRGDKTIDSLFNLPIQFRKVRSLRSAHQFRQFLMSLSKQVSRYSGMPLSKGIEETRDVARVLSEVEGLLRRHNKQVSHLKTKRNEFLQFRKTVPQWLLKLSHYPGFRQMLNKRLASKFGADIPNPADIDAQLNRSGRDCRQSLESLYDSLVWSEYKEAAEDFIDHAIRPTLFLLALRYFEGKWLAEMKATLKAGDVDKRSLNKVERKWRRRSKLHPCLVSTLHTLPRHMTYWDHLSGQELPAFNLIDWLIIDEAGQCAPDVAGPSLLVTKRLVSVGDENQIEPVWSINEQVDVGNLASNGLIDTRRDVEQQLERLKASGITASFGNMISVVEPSAPENRVMLTGHRRSVPAIIQFCNELCYEGRLKPLRSEKESEIPAMGFWHIPGVCVRAGGSRKNLVEAAAVASLVEQNKAAWLAECNTGSLAETVAIVTPFRQQALAIKNALSQALGTEGEAITVGTVHSLQGAQSPIVLFSMTYSSHEFVSMFFDDTPNMLNVVVSRAQDHFFVVGDMDVLRFGQGPARSLFDYLGREGKPLTARLNSPILQTALEHQWGEPASEELDGRDAHDEALDAILKRADLKELLIVTPLLTPDSLRRHGDRLIHLAKSGCRVEIIVSRKLNYQSSWADMFIKGCELLQAKGIFVRIVDAVFYGCIFSNGGTDWLFSRGSWLGGCEPGVAQSLEPWIEPYSIRITADHLNREHQRCLSGLGLEYHTSEKIGA